MIVGLYTLSASRRVYYSFIYKFREGKRKRGREIYYSVGSLPMKSDYSFYMLLSYSKINKSQLSIGRTIYSSISF